MSTPITDEQRKLASDYAAYANHCAIQRKVPMTFHNWKRAGRPGKP